VLGNSWQIEDQGTIQQIAAGRDFFNAIDDDRALRVKDGFLGIAVQLTGGKPAASGQPRQGITEPVWQMTEVIQRNEPAVRCGDHQIPLIARRGAQRGFVWVRELPQDAYQGAFCGPLLPIDD
jgi:hypothetical protein